MIVQGFADWLANWVAGLIGLLPEVPVEVVGAVGEQESGLVVIAGCALRPADMAPAVAARPLRPESDRRRSKWRWNSTRGRQPHRARLLFPRQ